MNTRRFVIAGLMLMAGVASAPNRLLAPDSWLLARPEARSLEPEAHEEAVAAADTIQLDAIVTDRKQRPIRNLHADDFVVSDAGEPRTIESVRLQSNGSRVVAIFLDEYHVAAGESTLRARAALAQFVETELRADDLVAIMKPLDPLNAIQLTHDRRAIREVIDNFSGRKGDYAPRTPFEENFMSRAARAADASRAQVVSSAVQALTVRLGEAREGRKAIVLVSEGFTPVLPRGSDRLMGSVRAIVYAANRYGVAIYPVNPQLSPKEGERPVQPPSPETRRSAESSREDAKDEPSHSDAARTSATLTLLAEQTGGQASINQVDLAVALKQVVADLDEYYVVTYNAPREGDGKFHPVELRVKRSDAQIRTRSGYWAADAALMATPGVTPRASILPVPPPHSSPYIRPWIGMSRGPDGLTTVTVAWEPAAPPPRNQVVASVTLKATLGDGRVLFQDQIGASEVAGNLAVTRAPGRATFTAPPGHISLEMAIHSSSGTRLDTDYRGLQVPDLRVKKTTFATPQLLRSRTARAFASLVANPDAVPSATREFSRAERLLVRVPVFGPNDTTPTVTATLHNRQGIPMRQLEQVTAALPAGVAGIVQFDLPLSWLAPDEYRIELVATSAGPPKDEAKEVVIFRITY
jgi:VWFA-related protein